MDIIVNMGHDNFLEFFVNSMGHGIRIKESSNECDECGQLDYVGDGFVLIEDKNYCDYCFQVLSYE